MRLFIESVVVAYLYLTIGVLLVRSFRMIEGTPFSKELDEDDWGMAVFWPLVLTIGLGIFAFIAIKWGANNLTLLPVRIGNYVEQRREAKRELEREARREAERLLETHDLNFKP